MGLGRRSRSRSLLMGQPPQMDERRRSDDARVRTQDGCNRCAGGSRRHGNPQRTPKKASEQTWNVACLTPRRRSMKKPSITAVLLVASIQLIAPTLSSGCTIIQSLWQLAGSADLVVVARVVRIESDELIPAPREQAGERETRTVLVDVLEVWKGSPPADLRVTFQYGAPRDLVPGKDVLLFLERGETEAQHRREALAM